MNPLEFSAIAGHAWFVRLTQVLLHFLWQGAAIGLGAILAGWWLQRGSAQVRYAIHLGALTLMALCPLLTLALLPNRRGPNSALAGPVRSAADGERSDVAPAADLAAAPGPGSAEGTASAINLAGPAAPAPRAARGNAAPLLARVAPLAATGYLLGALVMIGRLALGLWGGQRLRRLAVPITDAGLLAVVERQARNIGLKAAPCVAYCRHAASPVVVGVLRPAILLPAVLATGLDGEKLQAVLLHELAHVRRFDLVVNLWQRLVESLLFFHPAVWYVSRRMSVERENCCDDCVLAAGWSRLDYADALLQTAALCTSRHGGRPALQPAGLAATGRSGFKHRVLRLLDAQPRVRLTRSGTCLALLLLLATALGGTVLAQGWARADDASRREAVARPQGVKAPAVGNEEEMGEAEEHDADVRAAVERGIAYLKSQQAKAGSWAELPAQPGGVSSLCTLALLKSGVARDDDAVAKAVAYLRTLGKPRMVYATSLQTMALCAAGRKEDAGIIQRNVEWLRTAQRTAGKNAGGWSYAPDKSSRVDNSNTRFAVLALDAAERADARVAPETWQRVLDYFIRTQNGDGSWGYMADTQGTGTMTCAAITAIALSAKRSKDDDAVGRGLEAIVRGTQWLADRFSIKSNPGTTGQSFQLYYLDALARAATVTSQQHIGGHDWRREGTALLLRMQDATRGRWIGHDVVEQKPEIATSFALLFLTAHRSPPKARVRQAD